MLDAQMFLLENAVARYYATGVTPGRIGTRHPLITPFQAFPTSDGYVVVAGVKDWALFCALMDLDQYVADPRFATNELRTKNHADLEPILSAAFARRSTSDWIAALQGSCLIAPLNTVPDAIEDEQVRHRAMIVEVPAGDGIRKVVGSPLKYSRTKVTVDRGADVVGGHTAKVLRDILGLTDDQIAALEREGIIQTTTTPPAEKTEAEKAKHRPFG